MTGLLVALGAAVGAALRFVVSQTFDGTRHTGTLLVNLVGSFLLGTLVGGAVEGSWLALLGTGFCGGLTTYSAFAVQSVNVGARACGRHVAATIAGCLVTATLGHLAATLLS